MSAAGLGWPQSQWICLEDDFCLCFRGNRPETLGPPNLSTQELSLRTEGITRSLTAAPWDQEEGLGSVLINDSFLQSPDLCWDEERAVSS